MVDKNDPSPTSKRRSLKTVEFRDLITRRVTLAGLFILSVVLIPAGFVIFNAGRTLMKCSPESRGSPGIEEIYGGILVVTDGCNFFDVPFLSIIGAASAALIVGYSVVGYVR
jgi:hypothetical protein